MKRRTTILLTTCCLAAACAGPVQTRYGALPAPGAPAAPSLSSVSLASPAPDDASHLAVTDALRASGIGVDPQSDYELHIGIGTRPDTVGILGPGGAVRSAARKRRLFQSCPNRDYRLSLTLSDRRSGMILSQGWAEESHCAAPLTTVLPELARQSVAMLIRPGGSGSTLRWTQD